MQTELFINGAWVAPAEGNTLPVIDPATEEVFHQIPAATAPDADAAVAAARAAFDHGPWPRMTGKERAVYLRAMAQGIRDRLPELARLEVRDNGKPLPEAEWDLGDAAGCFDYYADLAEELDGEVEEIALADGRFTAKALREPLGVAVAIVPWNYPLLMASWKVAPALAAGCTMVLKPSEIAPLDAIIFAEIMHDAGVPPGVFNLVNGDGPTVGDAMSRHPGIDMMSFTGSTRAGILVAKSAADTVKRVSQELGGKSANILLPDVDLGVAVTKGVNKCFGNSGQSCNAPTRMLVQKGQMPEAIRHARAAAEKFKVAPAHLDGPHLGPVVSEIQFNKIQDLIESGIKEGAELVTGGLGRPEGLNRGYYVKPTVFANVTPDMRIAREEIFGPVLSIIPFDDEEEAVQIANDTPYGLASGVWSQDINRCMRMMRAIRSGVVWVNTYRVASSQLPFGGMKNSGYGRVRGHAGILEWLQTKTVFIDYSGDKRDPFAMKF